MEAERHKGLLRSMLTCTTFVERNMHSLHPRIVIPRHFSSCTQFGFWCVYTLLRVFIFSSIYLVLYTQICCLYIFGYPFCCWVILSWLFGLFAFLGFGCAIRGFSFFQIQYSTVFSDRATIIFMFLPRLFLVPVICPCIWILLPGFTFLSIIFSGKALVALLTIP